MTQDDSEEYASREEGITIRTEACRLAALIMAGRPDDSPAPLIWSLSVFFEKYIMEGCEATVKEFGPKRPTRLRVAKARIPSP